MKITIIGAGNVGATCASILSQKNILKKIVLVDIQKNIVKGKCLDIEQSLSIFESNTQIIYTSDEYKKTKNSKIIIITSGSVRKPGMSREELVNVNAGIVKSVISNIIPYSPNAIIIMVSNPLDIMTYVAYKASNLHHAKVIGMAGILDSARYNTLILQKLKNFSIKDIKSIILGNHGDSMIPLIKYTTVAGIPVTNFISKDVIEEIIKKTKSGGEKIVNLLNTSAWYAPSAAISNMVEIIIKNTKTVVSCCSFLQGQYGLYNIFMGVPVVLGSSGVEKIIELKLNNNELNQLHKASDNIQQIIKKIKL